MLSFDLFYYFVVWLCTLAIKIIRSSNNNQKKNKEKRRDSRKINAVIDGPIYHFVVKLGQLSKERYHSYVRLYL
jgi:hypothetical protein